MTTLMEMLDKHAREVTVAGRTLRCEVCEHDRFWRREAQLNTSIANFFGFDWTNTRATCMVCERCGYIHWFLPTHQRETSHGHTELAEEIEALRQQLLDAEPIQDLDEALTR